MVIRRHKGNFLSACIYVGALLCFGGVSFTAQAAATIYNINSY